MDRIGLKDAAKLSLQNTETQPTMITLVYMLIQWAVSAVLAFVSKGTVFDQSFLAELQRMDAFDMMTTLRNCLTAANTSLSGAANLLAELVLAVLAAGFCLYCLRLSRGTAKGFSDITEALSMTAKLVWLTIVIAVFTFLWSCLFIIPGFVAAYRYSMAYYALINDPNLTAMQALNVSKQITYGHKMELFVLDLSFLGWYILCALTFGILYIWKLPYIETTKAHAFNWLMGLRYGETAPGQQRFDNQGPEIL